MNARMNDRTCAMLIGLCGLNAAHAQNLVPNPGFENYDAACYPPAPWWTISNWYYELGGCVEEPWYFHPCFNGTISYDQGVPWNIGYQLPHSGDAYGGVWTFQSGVEHYSFLEVELTQPLQAGVEYCCGFWAARLNDTDVLTDSLHLYFSPVEGLNVCTGGDSLWYEQSSTTFSLIGVDTADWEYVESSFIAQGGERYMVLGNFHTNDEIDTTTLPDPLFELQAISFYYLDDIYLAPCDAGIQTPPALAVTIAPVPVERGRPVMVTWRTAPSSDHQIVIRDVQGRSVSTLPVHIGERTTMIPTDGLAPGIYLVCADTSRGFASLGRMIVQ